jgi:homoserine O-succinyltransferase/O-acetyltransferase
MSVAVGGSKVVRRLSPRTPQAGERPIRIGLINNMSDGAIARTEYHFTNLLQQAADGVPVEVVYYSLPVILRSGKIREHIAASYQPIDALWDNPPDAFVVTGAEPRQPSLKDELYWGSLTNLIDWIDELGVPAMFSCLAAHAAVLHLDGVSRAALDDKCFGVFEHKAEAGHPLMAGAGKQMWLPHTRWNQVNEAELVKAGYQIMSRSDSVGVGFFAKERRNLWLFCQGHPEYEGPDLLREYRRDVGRFLSGQRATYPELPRDYFQESEIEVLRAFRQQAIAQGDASVMDLFPQIIQGAPTWDAWRPAAIAVFGNWLKRIAATQALSDVGQSGYDQSVYDQSEYQQTGFNMSRAITEMPDYIAESN